MDQGGGQEGDSSEDQNPLNVSVEESILQEKQERVNQIINQTLTKFPSQQENACERVAALGIFVRC